MTYNLSRQFRINYVDAWQQQWHGALVSSSNNTLLLCSTNGNQAEVSPLNEKNNAAATVVDLSKTVDTCLVRLCKAMFMTSQILRLQMESPWLAATVTDPCRVMPLCRIELRRPNTKEIPFSSDHVWETAFCSTCTPHWLDLLGLHALFSNANLWTHIVLRYATNTV